jgi:hypothetical protein
MSELVSEYRRTQPTESARRIAIAVTTDALYRFPTLALASARSKTASTYAYLFTGGTGSHSEDVLYFFDNLSCTILVSQTAASQRLAEQASTAWITFCHLGTPTVPDSGPWSPHTATDRKAMMFGNPTRGRHGPICQQKVPLGEMGIADRYLLSGLMPSRCVLTERCQLFFAGHLRCPPQPISPEHDPLTGTLPGPVGQRRRITAAPAVPRDRAMSVEQTDRDEGQMACRAVRCAGPRPDGTAPAAGVRTMRCGETTSARMSHTAIGGSPDAADRAG